MATGNILPDPTADLHWDDFVGPIHAIFHENAQKHPDRTCVVETKGARTPERVFTYRQIDESSNQLAHYFLAHGCEHGDVVMIYAYRGVDLVVAYMGALKAGATVSVLDPQYPADRQKVLLEVASPRFLVQIQRASEESGPLPTTVAEFIGSQLKIKAEIPALRLEADGRLLGGVVNGADCLAVHEAQRSTFPDVLIGPDSTPTLSFTSGSEGRPKGVCGRHFSLTYYFPWMAKRFGLSDQDRFTMLSGIAHDPIQRDIFTPLFLGAQIVVPPRDKIAHELLAEWMRDTRVTVTHLTPAMGQILVGGATTQFPSLHLAFFVGDLLTKKDTRRLQALAPNASVMNAYGTTETQRAVSFYLVPSAASDPTALDSLPDIIPVGQGMLDVQLLVVDRENKNRICDVGEQGELYLRAGGLAESYLGADEATQQLNATKFLDNWFTPAERWTKQYEQRAAASPQPWMRYYKGPRDRIYRTGDLGRYRADGNVECTGRVDNQVKIRGFRIELGEIDTHLSRHPYVRENVTLVRRNQDEEPTLVSYIVPESRRWLQHLEESGKAVGDADLTDESMASMLRRFKLLSDDCKAFLKTKVPYYAVPTMFIPLARMPLNPNGKIDKPKLPFPSEADLATLHRRASRASSALASMTDTQKRLASLWAKVLPNHSARMFVPESNFFEEGGHSILAQRMLFLVRKEWKDIDVPMSAIFQSQTLAGFAAEIDRAQDPTGLRLDVNTIGNASYGHGSRGPGNTIEDAYAADARDLVASLPETIASATDHASATVFLTGATGFLGVYVLRELLAQNADARVLALVRSATPAAGLARIESIARAYGLWADDWAGRIEAVVGDFSQPKLGLDAADWSRVASTARMVVHNGALVNWMLPYSSMRAANVDSTLSCIQLCAEGAAKRLVFVSSTSDLDSEHFVALSQKLVADGAAGIPESDDLEGSRKGLATGYGQTKWASEFLVREAGRRGLVGAIVRPGYVTGNIATGISITDDFLIRFLKGCLQVGSRPDIANTVNQVPVTHVSRLIAAAARHPPSATGVHVVHVTSHPRLTMNEWLGTLEQYGYHVPQVSYRDWCSALRAYVAEDDHEEHALMPLFHFVVGDLPADSIAPELDDTNAAKVLSAAFGKDITAFPDAGVSIDAAGAYISYLVSTGFLPAPPADAKAARPLPACQLSTEQLTALAKIGTRSTAKS